MEMDILRDLFSEVSLCSIVLRWTNGAAGAKETWKVRTPCKHKFFI
jgi:hypothetical protein